MTRLDPVRRLCVYTLLVLGSAIFSLPFLWTVSTALKTPENVFRAPPQLIPDPVAWDNFVKAWTALPFPTFVANTVFIAVVVTVAQVFTGSLVAYGFARFQFRARNVLFYILLSTMMLPSQVTMIPVFLIWRQARMIDTFWPLILPAFFGGSAFNIFLLRQFFLSLPKELDEAALVDGAGYLRIWWSILLPLARPAVVAVTLFTFLAHWDDFMGPLIYLNSPEKYTVSIGLRMFQDSYSANLEQMMAASLMHIIPTIVLFFLLQRYFIRGIALSGIGGR
jgi:multiple sugar transport system permease protein